MKAQDLSASITVHLELSFKEIIYVVIVVMCTAAKTVSFFPVEMEKTPGLVILDLCISFMFLYNM